MCQISEGFSVWASKRKRLETTRHQHIIKTARQAGVEPMRTVESLLSPRGEIRIIVFITGAATVCDNLARLGRPSATRIAPAVRHCRTPSMRC